MTEQDGRTENGVDAGIEKSMPDVDGEVSSTEAVSSSATEGGRYEEGGRYDEGGRIGEGGRFGEGGRCGSVEAETADDAALFYSARDDLDVLADVPCEDVEPALKRIGQPPFARKGFPLLGLMATIYDHVAHCVESSATTQGMDSAGSDRGDGDNDLQ